eukprot:gene10765-22489_t
MPEAVFFIKGAIVITAEGAVDEKCHKLEYEVDKVMTTNVLYHLSTHMETEWKRDTQFNVCVEKISFKTSKLTLISSLSMADQQHFLSSIDLYKTEIVVHMIKSDS